MGREEKKLTKSPLLAYKKLLYLAKLDILLAFIYEPKHPEGDYLPTLISHKKLTSARGARTAVHGLNSALKLHQGKAALFVSSKKLLCAFHRTTSWPWSTPKTGDCTVRGAMGIHRLTRYETDCCWVCLKPEKPGICGYLGWVLFGFWLDVFSKHPVPKSAVWNSKSTSGFVQWPAKSKGKKDKLWWKMLMVISSFSRFPLHPMKKHKSSPWHLPACPDPPLIPLPLYWLEMNSSEGWRLSMEFSEISAPLSWLYSSCINFDKAVRQVYIYTADRKPFTRASCELSFQFSAKESSPMLSEVYSLWHMAEHPMDMMTTHVCTLIQHSAST